MKTAQITLNSKAGAVALGAALTPLQDLAPQWVLVFADIAWFADAEALATLRAAFPDAVISGCSTAGEIGASGVSDGECVVTAVHFDAVTVRAAQTELAAMDDSSAAGARVGSQLAAPDLRAVMVFGPGVAINGTALVDGLTSALGPQVPVTGGLAGDGGAFVKTCTLGPTSAGANVVAAVGFYGERLDFAHGSFGGWVPFGPARKVTRCDGNVLYELDGEPALAVYKKYLGEHASGLPASGLLFPFAILGDDHNAMGLIRTILGVDEAAGSLTLAGTVALCSHVKLMHASTDKLVDGAEAAADAARTMQAQNGESLAVLVSCIGRKLVMGDRIDEEVEAVGAVFGTQARLCGFYSNGEISPHAPGASCQLHNQTMTISWIGEH